MINMIAQPFKRKKLIKLFGLGFLMIMVCLQDLQSQSFVFGPKIGPSLGFQLWGNSQNRGALTTFHGSFFIESYEEDQASSLYAEIGFHKRGSSEIATFNARTPTEIFRRRLQYEFNNLSVLAGAKKILNMEKKAKPYYVLALRGEYTLSTNLDEYIGFGPYVPDEFFVRKLNYGFTVGGGFQYDFAELFGAAIEFTISPDISSQYMQPPLSNIVNRNGNRISLPEKQIRNVSIEISAVLRMKRILERI